MGTYLSKSSSVSSASSSVQVVGKELPLVTDTKEPPLVTKNGLIYPIGAIVILSKEIEDSTIPNDDFDCCCTTS